MNAEVARCASFLCETNSVRTFQLDDLAAAALNVDVRDLIAVAFECDYWFGFCRSVDAGRWRVTGD